MQLVQNRLFGRQSLWVFITPHLPGFHHTLNSWRLLVCNQSLNNLPFIHHNDLKMSFLLQKKFWEQVTTLFTSDHVHACAVAGSSHSMHVHIHRCGLGVTHGFILRHTDSNIRIITRLCVSVLVLCDPSYFLLCVSVHVRETSWCSLKYRDCIFMSHLFLTCGWYFNF